MKETIKTQKDNWEDWKWQQQKAIRNLGEVKNYFENIPPEFFDKMGTGNKSLKFQITPYMLGKIPKDISQNELIKNPWFLQFFPLGDIYTEGADAYNGEDNWEKRPEFPTSNLHHKYTNRALIRFRKCLSYCTFCFEALRTLEKQPPSFKVSKWNDWEKSLEYLTENPDIEEVILSGGEPLLLSDSKLERVLSDLDEIKKEDGTRKIRFKRIHTRVMTHNPYRVTDNLIKLISSYHVNEIALNIAHPSEITHEMTESLGRLREKSGRYTPMIVSHTTLLKNINNSADVLWELFGKLYENNIKPYYLIHTMPHIPYANQQRVSVKDGVKLMKELKRHKSNIALPEYIIAHDDGKKTVPLELGGTPEFQYTTDKKNNPIVRFLNWKNKWVEYLDAKDTIKTPS